MADANNGFNALFSEVWGVARSTATGVLQREAASVMARYETRDQIEQQAPFNQLARQSSNLGPNETRSAQRAAVLQTSVMQGPRAVAEAINRFPLGWVMVAFVVVVGVFLLRKK